MRSSLKQKRHRLRQLNSRTSPNHHTVRSTMTAFNGVFLCFLGNSPSAIPIHLAYFDNRLNVAFFSISHFHSIHFVYAFSIGLYPLCVAENTFSILFKVLCVAENTFSILFKVLCVVENTFSILFKVLCVRENTFSILFKVLCVREKTFSILFKVLCVAENQLSYWVNGFSILHKTLSVLGYGLCCDFAFILRGVNPTPSFVFQRRQSQAHIVFARNEAICLVFSDN